MQFQGNLYPDQDSMLDAIAVEWLTGGGWTDAVHVTAALKAAAWHPYAAECIRDWRLDRPGDDDEPSHMERYGYTAADLAEAFARLPDHHLIRCRHGR